VQVEYVLKQDDPASPCAGSIQHGFKDILDGIVQFDTCFDFFRHMTPREGYQYANDNRDYVHNHGKCP